MEGGGGGVGDGNEEFKNSITCVHHLFELGSV